MRTRVLCHMRTTFLLSLLSAFVVPCLDSNNNYTCYIQSFKTLASFLAEHAGMCLTRSEITEDRFYRDLAHKCMIQGYMNKKDWIRSITSNLAEKVSFFMIFNC